ncbi:MAG: hypothetical protein J0I87_15230, partial [Cellulomonas sp.]|nr:hypothetical protein [Cellulomonas sp.]
MSRPAEAADADAPGAEAVEADVELGAPPAVAEAAPCTPAGAGVDGLHAATSPTAIAAAVPLTRRARMRPPCLVRARRRGVPP